MRRATQVDELIHWREDVYSLVCTGVSSPTCDLPKNKHQLFQSPLFARTPHCGHFPRFPDMKGIPLLVTGFAASGPTCSGNPVMFLGQKLETDGSWLWRTRAKGAGVQKIQLKELKEQTRLHPNRGVEVEVRGFWFNAQPLDLLGIL